MSKLKSTRTSYSRRQQYDELSRAIASERLAFLDGAEIGSLILTDEAGETRRKVRRIVEKRVCQTYWKNHPRKVSYTNKPRSVTNRMVSDVKRSIWMASICPSGCHTEFYL